MSSSRFSFSIWAALAGLSLAVGRTVGAVPTLNASLEGDSLILRWNAEGFRLQQCDHLGDPWTENAALPALEGDTYVLRCSISSSTRFYRLSESSSPFAAPDYLGIVLDYEGQPVSAARVSGGLATDGDGVWSGSPDFSPTGWMKVEAFGFATTYFKPPKLLAGATFSEIRLARFPTIIRLEPGESGYLFLGSVTVPSAEATVSSDDLTSLPAYVGLVELDPLEVVPRFESQAESAGGPLLRAFAVQAVDEGHQPVSLKPGRQITLSINDFDPNEARPILARFDSDEGRWMVVDEGIERLPNGSLQCRLPQLAPLYGLFLDAPPAEAAAVDSKASSRRTFSRGVGLAATGWSEQAYREARARLQQRLHELEQMMEEGLPVDPANDAEVRSALEELARLAREYAKANPTESGKVKLGIVAESALRLGQGALADSLMQEATDLANQLAEKLLGQGDCGRVREMLHAMEQLMLLGGDEQLIQALEQKLEQLFAECDVWSGTITYLFFISQHHPGVDNMTLASGGGTWSERHDIRLATHAKTHVVTGEDRVMLSFPEVKYQDQDAECELSIAFYGQPAGHMLYLNFGGTYDGYTFNLTPVAPASGATPVSITQRHVYKYEDDDLGCLNLPGFPAEYPFPNYYSALMHGFLDSPPITLQEMLESGTHSGQGEGETIRGSEEISNAFPEPNFGRYPFVTGQVVWSFIRVQALLPLPE